MRLILDANSILNPAILRGVDHDEGRVIVVDGREVQVNSAQYGVDGFFEKYVELLRMFKVAPRDTLIVWDGKNAKLRRQALLPQYKVGRDKAPEVSEELNKAREQLTQMLRDLGATIVTQSGMEADDVIGYLCKNLRYSRNTVVTGDGDLCVLVDENTDVWKSGSPTWSDGTLNKNPYGPFPHKFITLYKATVGDTSDKIPGAKGFGDAKFVELVSKWGVDGLQALEDLIVNGQLDRLREDVADMKSLQFLIDNKGMVTTSWRVASLHTDDVNTVSRPLEVTPGMVKQWDELSPVLRVDDLRRFYGTKTLVHAGNYERAFSRVSDALKDSPYVALDIETSDTEASEEWIAGINAVKDKGSFEVDVLGHELTGMGLTFGDNGQHTVYMTVDHKEESDVANISVDQCRAMVELIPDNVTVLVQNRSFEFSVLYRTWGDKWKDNGWHGFLPNAIDTKIGASYVDENLPKGLKQRSKLHLGYEQQTYEETTSRDGPVGSLTGGRVTKTWDAEVKPAVYEQVEVRTVNDETGGVTVSMGNGKLLERAVTEPWERRQYRMNELTASEVFDYGADDTICTFSLHTYYQLVMEIERTWHVYLEVETLPEYLTSLAYVQGVKISQQKVREMEQKDEKRYSEAWATLRAFLVKNGWEGTSCPTFDTIDASAIKTALAILVDDDEGFSTRKRKIDAVLQDVETYLNGRQPLLLHILQTNDTKALNDYVRERFTGEPKINFGSPKQMQNLFYNVIGIQPRLFNKLTAAQREDPAYRVAWKKLRALKDGKQVDVTDEDRALWISKASTDDDAVENSLARDTHLDDEKKAVLKAFQTIKTVNTRRSLFYSTYKVFPHWRDGLIHPALNQSEAVTRRYSSSAPNAQQMPKRGEGVEFRQVVLPHCKDAVVVSMDFSGQELRLMAEQSGDENLTACYVGEDLKDAHSLTAVAAAIHIWGHPVGYDEFQQMRESSDKAVKAKAKALRDDAKTVNFASQYDAMAPKIASTMRVEEEVAQAFLDAKEVAFPRITPWKEKVRAEVEACGYATTLMGARRHLQAALSSDDKWEAAKAGRQGPNFKIQGSGGEQTKLALASMWRLGLFSGKYNARFYFPIHDEVVFSVHRDDALEVMRQAHECMVQPYGGMRIPIVSSISLGRNFGEQIECGDFFDAEKISAAIEEALA